MDSNLIYAKTPIGDEAVRQSTRVVQRNLRMVLVQVDGKMSVEELSAKIGNPRLVVAALRELEEGGYIAPTLEAASVWEESRKKARQEGRPEVSQPMSQFSVFGPKTGAGLDSKASPSVVSNFSSFGKPILPTRNGVVSGFKPSVAPPPYQPSPEPVVSERAPRRLTRRHWMLGAAGGLCLLLGTALFYPYDRFKPAIEAAATGFVGAPVKVGEVGVAFYPAPHLKLTGLAIGQGGEGRIAEVRVNSLFSLMLGSPVHISRIDITGARLLARQLVAMPFFKTESTSRGSVLVDRVHVDQSQVILAEGVAFQDVFGDLVFRPDASLEKATIESADRSLLIEAQPSPLGIALNIEGRAWQPAGTTVSFASLQAKGVLQSDKLLVQNIDTTFLGGILRGNWLLDWSNGLAMAGDASLSRIDTRKLAAAFVPSLKLEGDLGGTLRLRSSGQEWGGLWRNAEAVLNAEITRGTLYGVDLGEAARRHGVSEVRAGATKFDRLLATVNISPRQVTARDLRMDAGMVSATGQFAAGRDGEVEGGMTVTLQSSVNSMTVPLRIFGVLPDLTVAGRK